jgi:hypothetical protein
MELLQLVRFKEDILDESTEHDEEWVTQLIHAVPESQDGPTAVRFEVVKGYRGNPRGCATIFEGFEQDPAFPANRYGEGQDCLQKAVAEDSARAVGSGLSNNLLL